MIQFACSPCGMKFQVKDEFAGRSTACPRCHHRLVVPQPANTPEKLGSGALEGPASCLGRAGIDTARSLPAVDTPAPGTRTVEEAIDARGRGGNRYLLESEIARGGMGAILRGIDQDIRREVAIKVMLDDRNPRQKARFVEEAQITGQLEHPNIVPVHELGVDAHNRPFFSMKLVRGRSLAQVLDALRANPREAREWSLGRLLNVLVSVCHALAYAHSRGVIHRDLKPANIMVGDFGEVYVMDWGLAKVIAPTNDSDAPATEHEPPQAIPAASPSLPDAGPPSGSTVRHVATGRNSSADLTQDGTILGTPAYMSPEQARGERLLDQRSDVYSLGAILYSILTLQPPLDVRGDYIAALLAVAEGRIPRPEERAPERAGSIPPELSAIAMKALALDPGKRYQSSEDLRRDIELFLEGRSVSAKTDSTWEMARKFVKRNKGFSAAALGGMVLLLVVLLASSIINRRAAVRADEAREEAVQAYASFVKEQEEKHKQAKQSAPAFLRVARLSADERRFDDALAQVIVALEFDPDQTDAYLLKAEILIVLEHYADAVPVLGEYLRRAPRRPHAMKLLELAKKPEPKRSAYLMKLADVFQEQKLYAFAGRMSQLANDRFAGDTKERLAIYQKQLDAGWPGFGRKAVIDRDGSLSVGLNGADVKDLAPLKGMPINRLNLSNCVNLQNLEPLRGMPLTSLNLVNCTSVKDLSPLADLPLTHLDLTGLSQLSDLAPLRKMPLQTLLLNNCPLVQDLRPLQGRPLKTLSLSGCAAVRDLAPLRDTSLVDLNLNGCRLVEDLGPLDGMPLETVNLHGTAVVSIDALKNSPVTSLNLTSCGKLKSLEPLQGKRLKTLTLSGCTLVQGFSALEGMPLTALVVNGCQQLADLKFVRGMRLDTVNISGCQKITDLGPLEEMELKSLTLSPRYIQKGVGVLRGMKNLKNVSLDGKIVETEEFCRLFEKGEYRK